jgi:hypothetical protein
MGASFNHFRNHIWGPFLRAWFRNHIWGPFLRDMVNISLALRRTIHPQIAAIFNY